MSCILTGLKSFSIDFTFGALNIPVTVDVDTRCSFQILAVYGQEPIQSVSTNVCRLDFFYNLKISINAVTAT